MVEDATEEIVQWHKENREGASEQKLTGCPCMNRQIKSVEQHACLEEEFCG
jgi:hypothetical protein